MAFPSIPLDPDGPLGALMHPESDWHNTCYRLKLVMIAKQAAHPLPGGLPRGAASPSDSEWRVNKDINTRAMGQGTTGNIEEKCVCLSLGDYMAMVTALALTGASAGIECTATGCIGYEFKEVCKPCRAGLSGQQSPYKGCKCTDKKSVNLNNINSDSKEYEASDGSTVALSSPGDFQKVMEQIIGVEGGIPIDCITK